jgi:hypothetical protein
MKDKLFMPSFERRTILSDAVSLHAMEALEGRGDIAPTLS